MDVSNLHYLKCLSVLRGVSAAHLEVKDKKNSLNSLPLVLKHSQNKLRPHQTDTIIGSILSILTRPFCIP